MMLWVVCLCYLKLHKLIVELYQFEVRFYLLTMKNTDSLNAKA